MGRSPMFWRLFGTFCLLLLGAVGLLGVVLVGRVERHYLGQLEDALRARAVLLAEAVRGASAEDMRSWQARLENLRRELGTRSTLLAGDGTVLADSDRDPAAYTLENHADRAEVVLARDARFGVSRRRHSATVDQDMMYVALRTDDPKGAAAYVRVALPLDAVQAQLNGLRRLIWTAVAATALAALVVAFVLARRITRPLRELTEAAGRIAAGGYGHKVFAVDRDEIGTLGRTFNHMSDRLAEQFAQLEEDRQQLRTILRGMVEGVIALDAGQRILFANDRAGALLDFPTEAAVGRRLGEVVRHRSLQEVVRKALAGAEPCREELRWENAPARSLTVHAARLSGSPARGAVLVLHDTTELRRLERLRQEFVANVSHELKTPLSVIKACVETLLDGAADDPGHRTAFLEQIGQQAEQLHALILDLLSLARIEAGTEVFEFQEVPVAPAVAACLDRHGTRAEAKSLELRAVAPDGADGLAAWVDEEALREILDNLVDNAVKYTPEGGRISVRWRAEGGQVVLDVEDTGIGIPEHDLPRIFERFYRVDKARSRQLGGTGLGLAIVKHLVQAMHGSIQASSRLGHGTTFCVRLPEAPAE